MNRILGLLFLLLPTTALAGELGDSVRDTAAKLDVLEDGVKSVQGQTAILQNSMDQLGAQMNTLNDTLEGIVDELNDLDQRLSVLEGVTVPLPDPEPNPDPDPEPDVCILSAVEPGQEAIPVPGTDNRIPGNMEAEDFDHGGEGVAYHDNEPENLFGLYRDTEGVDIKSTGDTTGEYQIGLIHPGEWLEYTVCVEEGIYDVWLRVTSKSAAPGRVKVSVGGQELGTVQIPSTGAWDTNYTTVTLTNKQLNAGNKILRLDFLDNPATPGRGFFDLNWVRFVPAGTALNMPPTDIMLCEPLPDGNPNLDLCDTAG